ncbi:MAG: NAD(P)/FAD-dependent oxidoreductase, partial [Bdellovibrionales bacterium]|nr:NAD(P)/FAD-dependent oxidoreductase [Bdellovibrionales bacterium]
MNSAGLKFRFFSGAVLFLLVFESSTAQAFFFRRLFSRRSQPRSFVLRQPVVRQTQQPIMVRNCQNFSCTIQRQPIVYNNGHNNYYNNGRKFVNNRFDPNDFDQVPAFNRLKQQKGVLFEADGDGNVVSQLFIDPYSGELLSVGIDRFGNVHGYARPVNADNPVFAHLSKFYFENLDKFKTALRDAQIEGDQKKINKALNDLQLVNSFLGFARRKLGLERRGQVTFDIASMTVPKKYTDSKNSVYTQENVGIAGINYVLNMLSNRCDNLCVGNTLPGNRAGGCTRVDTASGGGLIQTNLSGFFNENTIDYMTNAVDNPYACGDRSRIRADHFIAATLGDPKMYYAIKQIPGNYEEYAAKKGTDANAIKQAVGRQAKMVVGPGESIVAKREGASRVTAVERQDRVRGRFGGSANGWVSFDYNNFNDGGISLIKGAGADLVGDPVGAIGNQAGGESIFEQCNGMHEFMVMAGNGDRADEVPASIASGNNAISGVAVASPLSCISCHNFGFRSGSQHEKTFINRNGQKG